MSPDRYPVLVYDYVPDILERRDPHRPGHLEAIGAGIAAGAILAAGATGDPPTGARIVFAPGADDAADAFPAADPYVAAGLVTAWRVEPWTIVAGAG